VVNLGVDYLGDFIFWFSVNDYRCWWRFGTLLEGVGCGWFKHRDMEHEVNSLMVSRRRRVNDCGLG